MPRRNLHTLFALFAFSVVCYFRGAGGRLADVIGDVEQEIAASYVEETSPDKLLTGALEGIAGQLDRYSSYLPPQEFKSFEQSNEQRFGGIGIHVTIDAAKNQIVILSPLRGGPAHRAGARAGDVILEVEGESAAGMKMDDLVEALRGEEGTSVRVTVLHRNEEKPVVLEIRRETIETETVFGWRREPDGAWNFWLDEGERIGYARVESFSRRTLDELSAALFWLHEREARGLVLDLRDNPGGLLDTAVKACNLFVAEGVIVSTRGRGGVIQREYRASPQAAWDDVPLAIIVNGLSASASEIFAACLQDHERAGVVGQRTFGKGSVQNVIPLDDRHGALKLTVAHFYGPKGKNIHKRDNASDEDDWGVRPNPGFEASVTQEQYREIRRFFRDTEVDGVRSEDAPPAATRPADPQLDKALEYLRGRLDALPVESNANSAPE